MQLCTEEQAFIVTSHHCFRIAFLQEDEMADAQGAFVTRSFEKLLKEAYGRKYQKLHQALKAYLGRTSIERGCSLDATAMARSVLETS